MDTIGKMTLAGMTFVGAVLLIAILTHDQFQPTVTNVFEGLYEQDLPELTTDVWGVFDPSSGRVLEGSNVDVVRPIASITKLFVAHAAVVSPKVDDEVVINWNDLSTEGRSGKLSYGERISVRTLLFPLLLESSNDAASAISRTIGPEFESENNVLVSSLPLPRTTIADPSGLSARNVSTVSDLARFAAYLKASNPYLFDITQLHQYIGEDTGWVNTSPAREISGYRGGKHGYTTEAGRTVVALYDLNNSGKEVGVVLLGSADLSGDIEQLVAYAKTRYGK